MGNVRRDDLAGTHAATSNPGGWLTVTVSQLGATGGQIAAVDFSGWRTFRQWVELSDPAFGAAMSSPTQIASAVG
jgi:hypothetical protein